MTCYTKVMTTRRIPQTAPTGVPVAPVLPRIPGTFTCYAGTVWDPYFGLRHLPKTQLQTVIANEKRYMKAHARKYHALSRKMAAEAKVRGASHPSIDFPTRYGNMYLFSRTGVDAQHPSYYVAPLTIDVYALMKDDRTDCVKVLDVNRHARDRGSKGYEVGSVVLHHEGNLLAYTECTDGSEKYHVIVKDLSNGHEYKGAENIGPDILFLGDDLLVSRLDSTMRPYQVVRTDVLEWVETVVHEEPDPERYLSMELSVDSSWLLVHSGVHDSSSAYAYKVVGPAQRLRLAMTSPSERGVFYEFSAYGSLIACSMNAEDGISLVTNAVTGDVLVPIREGYQIGEITTVKYSRDREPRVIVTALHNGEYVAESWSDGVCITIVVNPEEAEEAPIPVEGLTRLGIGTPAPVSVVLCNVDDRMNTLMFATTTWTTIDQFYTTNPHTFTTRQLHSWPAENYDPTQYEAIRLTVPVRDGTMVPCTLIRRIDTPLGSPTLAYVYGAYGEVMNGWHSETRVSLMDRGVMFLLLHVRGGGDFGRAWHTDGRMAKKMNTFTDVHDTVLGLRDAGVIGNVVLRGGSAGGGTVTAAANLDVEAGTHLYAGIIAEVPFVDALATMSDATLPLTVGEYGEWGNPNTAEGYKAISSWSPLAHIQSKKYPDFYIACGVNDPRVGYWEGLKLAAHLRKANRRNTVLVRMDVGAGHGGASGRFDSIDQEAEVLAFALSRLGVAV